MQGRDHPGVPHAKLVELAGQHLPATAVGLVRDHQHGGPRLSQQLGDIAVDGRQSFSHIEHKQHQVGFVDGEPALLLHPAPQLALRRNLVAIFAEHQPRRVDNDELAAAPLALGVEPVARQPRHRVDDGATLPQDPIEESGLANVRAADDRH